MLTRKIICGLMLVLMGGISTGREALHQLAHLSGIERLDTSGDDGLTVRTACGHCHSSHTGARSAEKSSERPYHIRAEFIRTVWADCLICQTFAKVNVADTSQRSHTLSIPQTTRPQASVIDYDHLAVLSCRARGPPVSLV